MLVFMLVFLFHLDLSFNEASVWSIKLGTHFVAKIYCDKGDPAESQIAIQIVRHGRHHADKPVINRIYPAGFGYPDSFDVARLADTNVYAMISYARTRINGFSNVWLFDSRQCRLVQVAKDLLNVCKSRVSQRVLFESAGSQYVTGHTGPMLVRRVTFDPHSLSARLGKWRPIR